MSHSSKLRLLGAVAVFTVMAQMTASAQQVKTVFVIAMENHNWTQPANQFSGGGQQPCQNPNAPFINSLVNGTTYALINNPVEHISQQVEYASNYHSVLPTASGNNPLSDSSSFKTRVEPASDWRTLT